MQWALLALAAIAVLLGCQGDRQRTTQVHGKVTYRGKPLNTGSLVFVPTAGGPPAQANIDPQGRYVLGTYKERDGAIPGTHKVMIVAIANPGDIARPEDAKGRQAGPIGLIPDRYGDPEKSNLRATVEPGADNEVNFDLTD